MTLSIFDNLARQVEEIKALDLFFIIGMPRSGTTWVQRLLDRHCLISCRGEAHFFDIFAVELQEAITIFNKEVHEQGGVVAHLEEYGGHVASLQYDEKDRQLMVFYAIALMLAKWRDSDEVRVIGEKTPDNIFWIHFLANVFPNAKFIHVIRDGRDCAVSGWFFNLSQIGSERAVADSFETYTDRYLKNWASGLEFARNVGIQNESRYCEIHFEKLVANPEGQLSRIFKFLDVKASQTTLGQCVASEKFQILSGGRETGQEDLASFFRKGQVGDWRTHFSLEHASRVWQTVGEKLSKFGYSET